MFSGAVGDGSGVDAGFGFVVEGWFRGREASFVFASRVVCGCGIDVEWFFWWVVVRVWFGDVVVCGYEFES